MLSINHNAWWADPFYVDCSDPLAFAAAESALFDVIALLDASVASKAEPLAAEFLEYLDYMDYNKYFDAMPTRKVSGPPML